MPLAKPVVTPRMRESVARCLSRGRLSRGEMTDALERDFVATFFPGRDDVEAVACSSGTTALAAAIRAVTVADPGRTIALPALTYVATENAINMASCVPFPVDVDPVTMVGAYPVGPGTMVHVHLYSATYSPPPGVLVIEDACEALGCHLPDGTPAGLVGQASAFSFYPNKALYCGEGGMAVFSGPQARFRAAYAREFVGQGIGGPVPARAGDPRYAASGPGFNGRMSEVSAALLLPQLEAAPETARRRRKVWEFYDREVRKVHGVRLYGSERGAPGMPWLPLLVFDHPESVGVFRDTCAAQGIETRGMFPLVRSAKPEDFPVAESFAGRSAAAPLWPGLSEERVVEIVGLAKAAARRALEG